jgi:hypothetical protein
VAITFRGRLRGDHGALIQVPPEVMAQLGPARRPRVCVTVNGVELRTTIAVYDDTPYIGLRREIRTAAGVAAGDEIELSIELDTAPRIVSVPDDFAAALAADAAVHASFDALAYTGRREYVQWIVDARRPETRQRRVHDAVELLKAGRRTPR